MTAGVMSDPKIQLIEGEIGVVNLVPGDWLVLMFPQSLSPDQIEYINAMMKERLPGVQCLVLADGGRVGVIHETKEDA